MKPKLAPAMNKLTKCIRSTYSLFGHISFAYWAVFLVIFKYIFANLAYFALFIFVIFIATKPDLLELLNLPPYALLNNSEKIELISSTLASILTIIGFAITFMIAYSSLKKQNIDKIKIQLADELFKVNSEMIKSLSLVKAFIKTHTESLEHWKKFSASHPEAAMKLLIKTTNNIELCQRNIDVFVDLINKYSFTSFIDLRFLSMLKHLNVMLHLIRFDLDGYKLILNDARMLKVFYLKFKNDKAVKLTKDIEIAIADAYLTSTCICDSLMYGIVPFRLHMLKRQLKLAFGGRTKQL